MSFDGCDLMVAMTKAEQTPRNINVKLRHISVFLLHVPWENINMNDEDAFVKTYSRKEQTRSQVVNICCLEIKVFI